MQNWNAYEILMSIALMARSKGNTVNIEHSSDRIIASIQYPI
jgi:hypothetical protein